MRQLLIGAALAVAVPVFAFAAEDPMANTYGNTVISKGGSGESRTHYQKDGTLDATLSGMMGSVNLKGTWKISDKGELCRTYTNPPAMLPIPNPLCTPLAPHKVGDTWTIQMGGSSRTVTLVQGIQ